MRLWLAIVAPCCMVVLGCGTSKWTDTSRTATEQILLSDAMDRAVSQLDFRALAGKTVYLDATYLRSVIDSQYLISTMRQHMLASGCVLRDKKEEADYIVEIRAGAIGTDRHDLLYGVPATEVPGVVSFSGAPRAIPEMPIVKKTEQRGVARIAVFAYNSTTGRPVWQSGLIPTESNAKDLWVLGAGPFQRGTIYDGTKFAGDKLNIPLIDPMSSSRRSSESFSVTDEAYFSEPIQVEEQVVDAAEPDSTAEAKAAPESTQAAATPKEAAPSKQKEPAEAPAAAQAAAASNGPPASEKEETPKEPVSATAAAPPKTPKSSQEDEPPTTPTATQAGALPKAPTPCQVELLPQIPQQASATDPDAAPTGDTRVSPAAHTEPVEEKD